MNEVQGPTPAGTSRPYRSLAEALRAHRTPPEHHDTITAITDAVGITGYIDRGRYIEALRRGEGAPLHIGRSYVNGFSADEQVLVGGRMLPLLPSEGRAPYHYVDLHALRPAPVQAPRRATGSRSARTSVRPPAAARAAKPVERDYGVCEVCFMVRNAAGTCACDA